MCQTTDADHEADERLWARQEFFAAAAHDLKTPLSSLTLWVDTLELLKPRLSISVDAQAVALLDQALQQMHTLILRSIHLIDDVLDVMRLDTGRPLPFTPAEVDMVALVRRAIQERPDDPKHDLHLESAEGELWGWWDADRMARLLDNLVANAIKYSPAGKGITVRVARDDTGGQAWAILKVEDRGIGIPAAELPRIFEPFHRATNVTPAVEGSGVGLWGCRAIVQQHGGALTVASQEGKGTTFTVRLPLSQRRED